MYNYLEAMENDVREAIKNGYDLNDWRGDRDGLEEKLNDDLWIDDSVTGNGSGSYTFNREQAREYVEVPGRGRLFSDRRERQAMNQQERASELKIIVAHISSVKDDLDSYVYRLSEAKCKKEADKLLSVIGRLEQLQWEIARHCEK